MVASMAQGQYNVICLKWGKKYSAEYVNKLYSMTRRNVSLQYRFICITDDPEGIRDEVEIRKLPDTSWSKSEKCWEKLVAFASPLFDIEGTSLFLDLDVVIVDNIDCFFTHMPDKEFIIIKDWHQKDITGNSSVFRYQVNRHPDVLGHIINNFDAVSSRFRDEQSYLTDHMHAKGF